MKKVLLTVLMLTSVFVVYAQDLTLDQLIALSNKKSPEAVEYLMSKGWSVNSSKQQFEEITFTYGYDNLNKTAKAWLTMTFLGGITYQCPRTTYEEILQTAKRYSMKMIDYKIMDNSITSVYEGKSYQLYFIITTDNTSYTNTTTYVVQLFKKVE